MDGWFIYRLMFSIGCFSAEPRLIQAFKVLRNFNLCITEKPTTLLPEVTSLKILEFTYIVDSLNRANALSLGSGQPSWTSLA